MGIKLPKFKAKFIAHVLSFFSPKWEYNLSKSVLVNHFIAKKWEPIFSAAHVGPGKKKVMQLLRVNVD